MAAGLHGSARTAPRVRAELRAAKAPTRALAAQYGPNPKAVRKWRSRAGTADAPMGPCQPRGSVLTEAEEATVVEFRRRTLPPLDDVLGRLRETIPRLTRPAPHRRLVGHGISRLPRDEEKTSKRKRFAETAIGYVHVDACELRPAGGKTFTFLAIGRVPKFAHAAFLDADTELNGAAFLREVVQAFPCKIRTVPTDDGVASTPNASTRRDLSRHIFDRVCGEHGVEHRPTKPCHPWTDGRAERMNRAVKDATSKAFHHPGLEALEAHVLAFVAAYDSAKRLKALRWRTPFHAVCDAWATDPAIFRLNPHHLIPGPHT